MPELLAAASILVAVAGAVSLLLVLPAAGLAETAGESNAASRARTWLAALVLPLLAGVIAAGWALLLYAQGLAASPHLGGQRPHLCLLPLLNAPAGAYRLRMFSWFALALVGLAVLRLLVGAFTSHVLRRLAVASGGPLRHDGPSSAAPPTRGQPGAAPPSRQMPPAEGPREDPATAGDEAGPSSLSPDARDNLLVVDLGTATSFCAGLLRPVVVISSALLEGLGAGDVEAIAAHELGHARRHDNLAGLIADVCTILLVVMPTAHYYRQQWRAAAEAAADDAALASGVPASSLRGALEAVRGAAQRRRPGRPSFLSLLIPPPDVSTQRIRRLAGREPAAAQTPSEGSLRRWLPWLVFALSLGAIALVVLVSRQSVEDSLFCAAEQLIRAGQ